MIHAETLQPSAAATSTRRPRRVLRRVGAVAAGLVAIFAVTTAATRLTEPVSWISRRLTLKSVENRWRRLPHRRDRAMKREDEPVPSDVSDRRGCLLYTSPSPRDS